MRPLAALVLVALTSGGLLVEYEAAMLLRDLRVSVRASDPVLGEITGAARQANTTFGTINAVAVDEAPRLKKEAEETLKVTANLHDVIVHTDENLNLKDHGVLPLLYASLRTDVLPQTKSILAKVNRSMDLTNADLVALQAAIVETNKLIADADLQVTDPNIKKMLDELATSGAEASASMAQLLAILTDGRQVADSVRETYLKPVNIWIKTVEKLLGIAPPIVTAIGTVK